MPVTVAIVEKEPSIKAGETGLWEEDRTTKESFQKLHNMKKRSADEEKRYKALERKVIGIISLESSAFPVFFFEEDLKAPVERVHRELVEQFGNDTPQKRILIQRLSCEWGHAWSYERMFQTMKYRKSDDGDGYTFKYDTMTTQYLAQLRRSMDSANDQIIRLTQVLQNLVSPPIQVMAKNAIVAQNMQINQGIAPKDFDKKTTVPNNPEDHAKAPS